MVAAKFEDLLPSHLGGSHTERQASWYSSCLVVGGHSQLCCHHHHGSIVWWLLLLLVMHSGAVSFSGNKGDDGEGVTEDVTVVVWLPT